MNAYTHSTALAKLKQAREQRQPLRLACLDIDGTWAGPPEEQQTVRDLLETQGYAIAEITNRAAELCLSQIPAGPQRPELAGLLDPDIVAANFGTELLLKQTTATYQGDEEYHRRLPQAPQKWQARVDQLLNRYQQPDTPFTVHYRSLPVFRLETKCRTPRAAQQIADQLRRDSAHSLHVACDEKSVIITPAGTSKEDAAERIITALLQELNTAPYNLNLLLAGDSAADAVMGLSSGQGTNAVFLIPGGASLAHKLKMTKMEKDGMLRPVVIGDEVFPETVGPQTLIAWLRQTHS